MIESPAADPRRCYEAEPGKGSVKPADKAREADNTGDDDILVCARCEARITTSSDRVRVRDQHEHYFVNPHGYDFRIGCFASAPGCISAGRSSSEWTWFAGYTWQLDHCRGCAQHLGWIFRSRSHVFHGLILDRLAPSTRSD